MFLVEFKVNDIEMGIITIYGHFDNKAAAEDAIKQYIEEGIKYNREQSARFV